MTINVTFDVGSVLTGVGVLGTAVLSWLGYRQSKATHMSTNSKMDQLLAVTGSAKFAEGKLAGKENHIGERGNQ
jgi:threonine/homoserine/homoserine lactone efflux protein